jgi:hypothetical protein
MRCETVFLSTAEHSEKPEFNCETQTAGNHEIHEAHEKSGFRVLRVFRGSLISVAVSLRQDFAVNFRSSVDFVRDSVPGRFRIAFFSDTCKI